MNNKEVKCPVCDWGGSTRELKHITISECGDDVFAEICPICGEVFSNQTWSDDME